MRPIGHSVYLLMIILTYVTYYNFTTLRMYKIIASPKGLSKLLFRLTEDRGELSPHSVYIFPNNYTKGNSNEVYGVLNAIDGNS